MKNKSALHDGNNNSKEKQNLSETLRMPKGAKKPKNTSK